ncbi:MAG: cysteine--tRNA ligase [Alphaproteobacteria bacterium]|nr:cysteine--tRNA ligase [Alphaproteobacteria bacterium]
MKFFNTLTRKEEVISTLEPEHLKMYVCGPTVYDRPHIGNARSAVIYDILFRLACVVFPKVTYVRNITDVDDKINVAAKEQGISIQSLTKRITEFFYADMDALNILRPTYEPRATEHIVEMIMMIEQLISSGHAYISGGHVLFDVTSYNDYGILSNRHIDEMIAGARVEVAEYKKHPLDFVLWKPADNEDDISSIFASPWGNGRPGWHIECSAMSSKYLGADFDIHGGGADLQFPHHENEIAQSRCANPNSHFARFWIHNGFLTVNGEKMSKSLKNFVTVRDLLDKGVYGSVIRYLLLSTHYRKPLDFNEKALADAQMAMEKFHNSVLSAKCPMFSVPNIIIECLSDDLNISKVIAELHRMAKHNEKEELMAALSFLGLFDAQFFSKKSNSDIDEEYINSQIAIRLKYKQERNFTKADEVRQELVGRGVVLEDVADGKTVWKII